MIRDFLARYRWYRRLCGGTWYLNKYQRPCGGSMLIWERVSKSFDGVQRATEQYPPFTKRKV